MLLIAYPELNFWFHADTGLAWLRDESADNGEVRFHCLNPTVDQQTPDDQLFAAQGEVTEAYLKIGATVEEANELAIPIVFINRTGNSMPQDLPRWFLAIAADGSSGIWIIHTGTPTFAGLLDGPEATGLARIIHAGPAPNRHLELQALAMADDLLAGFTPPLH